MALLLSWNFWTQGAWVEQVAKYDSVSSSVGAAWAEWTRGLMNTNELPDVRCSGKQSAVNMRLVNASENRLFDWSRFLHSNPSGKLNFQTISTICAPKLIHELKDVLKFLDNYELWKSYLIVIFRINSLGVIGQCAFNYLAYAVVSLASLGRAT